MTERPETERRPGEWPTPRTPLPTEQDTRDNLRAQVNHERARHELTLGAIRAHLEEQPSERTVREAARNWITTITNLADDIIRGLR